MAVNFGRGNIHLDKILSEDHEGLSSEDFKDTKSSAKNPLATDNILHRYATYNTLFTISGITQNEISSGSFLTDKPHDILARSGGIGGDAKVDVARSLTSRNADDRFARNRERIEFRDKYADSINLLGRAHDIFIENVNLLSTVGPSEERSLADFVSMEFKIHEPFGITFIEKVRAATRLNGFRDYQDAPLLLTIEFRGFDENGKQQYVPGHIRKIPILITRVDIDVNEGGAIYDVRAVRYQDLAFDDRFKFPRTEIDLSGDTPMAIGAGMAEQLKKHQEEFERDKKKIRQLVDTYVFTMDDQVKKIANEFTTLTKTTHSKVNSNVILDYGDVPERTNVVTTNATDRHGKLGSSRSVVKAWEDVIREGKYFKEIATDFWTTYLRQAGLITQDEKIKSATRLREIILSPGFEEALLQHQYVNWFKIKTNVTTHTDEFDNITKMHRKTIEFKAVLHKIHILKFIRPGLALPAGQANKLVRRVYNYIYTGENVDVQDLRINYKTAYYMRNVYKPGEANQGNVAAVFSAFQDKVYKNNTVEDPNELLPLRQYPSIIKGQSLLKADDGSDDSKTQQFYDYLTNPTADMMRIELTILGDPAYICQDQFVPGIKKSQPSTNFDFKTGSFTADAYSPLIEINYRLPDDINEKKGVSFETDNFRDENLFFNGVYQVVRIESSIENGQFLQTLTCVRLNNQDGSPLAGVDATSLLSDQKVEQELKKKLKDEIRRQESKQFGLGDMSG